MFRKIEEVVHVRFGTGDCKILHDGSGNGKEERFADDSLKRITLALYNPFVAGLWTVTLFLPSVLET